MPTVGNPIEASLAQIAALVDLEVTLRLKVRSRRRKLTIKSHERWTQAVIAVHRQVLKGVISGDRKSSPTLASTHGDRRSKFERLKGRHWHSMPKDVQEELDFEKTFATSLN